MSNRPALEAVVDRLGGGAAVDDLGTLGNQPGVQRLRDRPRALLPLGEPLFGRHVIYFTLDSVELANKLHGRGGNAALVGLHQLHKVTARMRHTATLDHPLANRAL
jgi:hypothetical protein